MADAFQARIRSQKPGSDEWGTVARHKSDDPEKLRVEVAEDLARWKYAATDAKSPLSGWRFKSEYGLEG